MLRNQHRLQCARCLLVHLLNAVGYNETETGAVSVPVHYYLIPQNSKRFSDSEESTNPAVRVTERKS